MTFDAKLRRWRSGRLPKVAQGSTRLSDPAPHTALHIRPQHPSVVSASWAPGTAVATVVCAGCRLMLVDRALNALPFIGADGTL